MIGAVVLAAGAATRFGTPKQRLLLEEVLARVRAAGIDEVVVVAGAYDLETTAPVVLCPDWERGPGASLRCGLAALSEGAQAAIVVLADGPDLAPESIGRVVEAWQAHGDDVARGELRRRARASRPARARGLGRDPRRGCAGACAAAGAVRRPRRPRRRRLSGDLPERLRGEF